MDLQAAPIVKGIFWLRAVPTMLRGQLSRPQAPGDWLRRRSGAASGPGRGPEPGDRGRHLQPALVPAGHLPPVAAEEFATFAEPRYVKIAYTLGAEPLGPGRSRFVTRTRVVTTDAEARRRFRRYWAPMSAGIILIRYMSLPMVKGEDERRARNQRRRSDDLLERMRWRIPTRPDQQEPFASGCCGQ